MISEFARRENHKTNNQKNSSKDMPKQRCKNNGQIIRKVIQNGSREKAFDKSLRSVLGHGQFFRKRSH